MKYATIKTLKEEELRRLTGVRRETFEAMAELLRQAEIKQKSAGGKPNTLGIEDRLLMTLEYWWEYRTYFHIAQAYGISESAAYRNIKWGEDTRAKSKAFGPAGAQNRCRQRARLWRRSARRERNAH